MAALDPALGEDAVLAALGQAAARPDGRRRIAAAVTAGPACSRARAPALPSLASCGFISALARAGATAVVEPTCPRCGRQRPLSGLADGLRICGGCRGKARALRCGRCGKVSPVARRNDGGQPICQNCWHRDPRSWKPCAKCGNERRVAAVTEAGPVCQSCRPGPDLRLQHLRVGRREQDRDLPGNRHPGLQPVPQAVGRLLPLRDRGAAEGRHAGGSRSAPAASTPTPPSGSGAPPARRPGSCRRRNARAAAWTGS